MLREIVRGERIFQRVRESKVRVEIQRWIFVFVAETFDFSRTACDCDFGRGFRRATDHESGSGRLSEF